MIKIRAFNWIPFVAFYVFAFGWLSVVPLYADSCCSSSSKPTTVNRDNNLSYQPTYRQADREATFHAPHGGQLAMTTWNYFEVVYGPHETHIYVYDMFRLPKSARGIHGQAFMRVRSNGGEWRYPLEYVPVAHGQDYLAVRVDLTRVTNGDMDVYFDLTGMPNRDATTARFGNVFARPAVAESKHLVARLPVTKERSSQPPPNGVLYRSPQIVVTNAIVTDDAAIRAQGLCPVMNQPLGSHGNPTKILIDGRPVFVCCQGCTNKVKQNPSQYLAIVGG